ncbi:MAG: hypothetical protein OXH99_25910 [Bryobacterales bacterium]|nr:hypothetical protein [Bryobacterales bacterium]
MMTQSVAPTSGAVTDRFDHDSLEVLRPCVAKLDVHKMQVTATVRARHGPSPARHAGVQRTAPGTARSERVAAAEPPQHLQRKKNRRRSEDGLRLHSFLGLLQALATRSRHQCRMRSDRMGLLLILLTDPTPLQKRAMELWRAFPVNNTPSSARMPL